MTDRWIPRLAVALILGWQIVGNCGHAAADEGPDASNPDAADVDYERDVKPILKHHCYACHSGLKQEGDLRLDSGKYIFQGGFSGPAVEPGDSHYSELYDRLISEDEDLRMPQESSPMRAEEIAVLKRWIDAGASFPDDEPEPLDPLHHWSFLPPVKPELPPVAGEGSLAGSSNPIDRILAAKHAELGLAPAPLAGRETLLRRLYFDLIGLPPTAKQMAEFLADESPEAYERVVDRLLESPEYAERWARHWMDVWRYSDWDGFGDEVRESHPHMWRFRDWIIESLAEDKPYRQMVIEMLAADELDPLDLDNMRATGFLARNYNKHNRTAWLENTVEHTGKALLGVTLNCARCHDHKYDPISQEEYFQWRAVFEPHSVRVDTVQADSSGQQQMTRVYDANLEAETLLLRGGDEKRPVKDRPITARLPRILGGEDLPAESVDLPLPAWNPAARPEAHAAVIDEVKGKIRGKERAIQKARRAWEKHEPAATEEDPSSEPSGLSAPGENTFEAVFNDDFQGRDESKWTYRGSDWQVADGQLKQVSSNPDFHMLLSRHDHPRNFLATYRFTIRGGDGYRSIGFSFDMEDLLNFNAVYNTAFRGGPKIQVFHRVRAADVYPEGTSVDFDFELNRPYDCSIAVRGDSVYIWIDDELLLSKKVTHPRFDKARFALWTHSAIADFDFIKIAPLDPAFRLPKVEDLDRLAKEERKPGEAKRLELDLKLAELELAETLAELKFVEARAEADLAAFADPSPADAEQRKQQAVLAERAWSMAKLEVEVAQTKRAQAEEKIEEQQRADLASKLNTLNKSREELAAALEDASGDYAPLAETFPQKSTGRRLALAQQIVDPNNPLAARVAVNHLWLRHFGAPLVASVFDLGINGRSPVSQDLLDWLAVDFMESGWTMKRMHRLMVTSHFYRLDSTSQQPDPQTIERDPDNRYFWRMNSRRLEAEAIRDAILQLDGRLELQLGGPDLDPATHVEVPRRSIYFRHSKEKRITFLDTFDLADVTDCYQRDETVMPQQSLALANSDLVATASVRLRERYQEIASDEAFIEKAFQEILNRPIRASEMEVCLRFLKGAEDSQEGREGVIRALLNHHEFVTVR